MKLQEDSLTPLYQQLMEEIKRAIETERFQVGEKIPTEPELSEMYSVSRITVRRAVNELCEKGYLVKKQGKGTYVARPKVQRKIKVKNTMSFSDVCRENGMIHSVRVLSSQHVAARQDEWTFLGLEPGAPLLYMQRIHYADGVPIQVENCFYPLERYRFLEDENLNEGSLFHRLRDKYGINVCGCADTIVEIVRATPEYAALLDVPIGEPLFFLNNYFVDDKGTPLFVGRDYIAGSRYVMHI
jgi:GntR family transcriptional regulator